MTLSRRPPLAIALALCAATCFPVAAGADLFPAGNFQVSTVTADTFVFVAFPNFTNAGIFVQDVTTQANPLVGPSTTTTVVQLSMFWSGTGADGNPTAGNGCSLLAHPSDFTVASGTSGAKLQTTLTGSEQPCDQFEQVLPAVAVSATWSSTSNNGSGRTNSRFDCGAYSSQSLTTRNNFGANATFSISALSGTFSDNEAFLSSSAQSVHAQGTLVSTCIQPGGKGAGPGPQAPGRYEFDSNIADFSPSQSDQTDPHVDVFVNRFVNTSTPRGGAPTTTAETDVLLFVQGTAGFGFGCFVLQPPAVFTFDSNLSSADLQMHIDSNTPTCQPSFGNFPFLPTDVNVTWTGVGPDARSQTDSQGSCGSFSEETFFNDDDNNATATATLSFFQGQTFTGGQSFLGTSDHSFQIQGAPRCPHM